MLSTIVSLLVFLLIACVLLYVARLVISAFPLPAPIGNIVYAIIVLLVLILFLSEIGWVGAPHAWRMWH